MGRLITAPGVLKNVQGQIDHVTQLYDEIKDNNLRGITIDIDDVSNANGAYDHTTTGLTQVTENMKAIAIEVDTPEVFCDQISITPGNGTVRLQCSEAHGTSKVKVTFVHTRPVDGGETAPDGVTSTEFDVLAGRIGSLSALDTSTQTSLVAAVNELVANDQDIREAMAIVANGNTHAAIGADKYVFVKNHSTLDTGLYHNKSGATIGLNAELSLTNLEPDPEGMANALNSKIAKLISVSVIRTSSAQSAEFVAQTSHSYLIVANSNEESFSGLLLVLGGTSVTYCYKLVGAASLTISSSGMNVTISKSSSKSVHFVIYEADVSVY